MQIKEIALIRDFLEEEIVTTKGRHMTYIIYARAQLIIQQNNGIRLGRLVCHATST